MIVKCKNHSLWYVRILPNFLRPPQSREANPAKAPETAQFEDPKPKPEKRMPGYPQTSLDSSLELFAFMFMV